MTKSLTTHRIHIILTAKQYDRLALESKRTGAKFSELIRRAIDSYVPVTRKKVPA